MTCSHGMVHRFINRQYTIHNNMHTDVAKAMHDMHALFEERNIFLKNAQFTNNFWLIRLHNTITHNIERWVSYSL